MQEIEDKYVFVCAKDNRLNEAFKNHTNIIIVKDYEDFKRKSILQFVDDYFIEKVNTELDLEITKDNIIEYWYNIEDNQNVLIKIEDGEYIVEVDSGEIVSNSKPELYSANIEQLIHARNFDTTHNKIEQLSPYVNYFSDDEILSILNASFSNNQIGWIIDDEDVKRFIGKLYKAKKELVENDVADFLEDNFK